jgi:hypothetical protein
MALLPGFSLSLISLLCRRVDALLTCCLIEFQENYKFREY